MISLLTRIQNVIHSQILENENERVERPNERVTVYQSILSAHYAEWHVSQKFEMLVTHPYMSVKNFKCLSHTFIIVTHLHVSHKIKMLVTHKLI